jgi:ABC-2 type transport system permease protein
MMSVIEDRKEGCLLSVLVAPVSRSVIVLGKVLGGATLATLQGVIFLVFAPAVGVCFTLASLGLTVLSIFLLSSSLWLRLIMRINPLTYGTDALRSLMFPGSSSTDLSLGANFAVLGLFTLVMFGLSFLVANRRTTKPAA